MISERISDDIPPQMKILNMVIPILMLLTFFFQKDRENVLCCAYTSSGCQLHKTACQLHIFSCQLEKRRYVMTSGLRQYIAGYTVANL